ncbi:MAG TPA: M1 family aminopeptidase [Tenuifilaceae bacterium]|nr:M1 family aminopeptidase [Tenuifilaceae bacterium]
MKSDCYRIFLILLVILASCKGVKIPEEGVSIELAQSRSAVISDVKYDISFSIPRERQNEVTGKVAVEVELSKKCDIVLDFRSDSSSLAAVIKDGKQIDYEFVNGHIVVPAKFTNKGKNSFEIEFIAGNSSLNRNDNFLYTLLVPDRASTVFPCFDQPDLKAEFTLSLDVPSEWVAVSNGELKEKNQLSDSVSRFSFYPTKPISTYLFAFAAGEFSEVTRTVQNRTFSLFHRETDTLKLNRNLDILFSSHAAALEWLENYTGIPYPFGKLDFVLIPEFQYSGMEHAGAIFYRDSRLLLDENPTETQKLQQANLIAHEVAHQWFGNLVTMRWFNDVWLKEVFASYMADLIVNPQYPDINHNLNFLLSHFPRAYSVDRTQGANPIVQKLDNLLFAGTLYGDIIYHKAPVMMQQLVLQMGEKKFQLAVREYLQNFSMANATWGDLVEILDKHSDFDLLKWSEGWTQETGRPAIRFSTQTESILVAKSDGVVIVPTMQLEIANQQPDTFFVTEIILDTIPKNVKLSNLRGNDLMIYNSSGTGYGCFIPDSSSLSLLLKNPFVVKNSLSRAAAFVSLHEMFLEGLIQENAYLNFLLAALEGETESQIRDFLLVTYKQTWWQSVSEKARESYSKEFERVLWEFLKGSNSVEQKRSTLMALASTFITSESVDKMYSAWERGQIYGIEINENLLTDIAFELMVRIPEKYEEISQKQRIRICNPDRLERFNFVVPALSPDIEQRLALFEKLKDATNRRPEPTALEVVRYLHHPLRSDFSITILEQSLDLLPEIQRTGDIFFPKNWLDAFLRGHSSPEAKRLVVSWIDAHPELSPNLKAKLLQSADLLFRTKRE